jgi:hypothetical protein
LRYDARAIATRVIRRVPAWPCIFSQPNDRFFSLTFRLNAIALTLVRRSSAPGRDRRRRATFVLITAWMATPATGSIPSKAALSHCNLRSSSSRRFSGLHAGTRTSDGQHCRRYGVLSPAYWTWAAIVSVIGRGLARWDDRLCPVVRRLGHRLLA